MEDHNRALLAVLEQGRSGEVYNIGGNSERRNIDVVKAILSICDRSEALIRFVEDRPGHDRRYAVDGSKIERELGFVPTTSFEDGLAQTVEWYRSKLDWCENVRSGAYMLYYEKQYGKLH